MLKICLSSLEHFSFNLTKKLTRSQRLFLGSLVDTARLGPGAGVARPLSLCVTPPVSLECMQRSR